MADVFASIDLKKADGTVRKWKDALAVSILMVIWRVFAKKKPYMLENAFLK